jgi:hypothetical protein
MAVLRYKKLLADQIRATQSVLKEGYDAPQDENKFKQQVFEDSKETARVLAKLEDGLTELDGLREMREAETSKRWQATYDYLVARYKMQIAYMYEYQSMLGAIRKELPPRDPDVHRGWHMASQINLQGDSRGRRLAKDAKNMLDELAKQHANTPWAIMAKRDGTTALGLEWQPTQ